MNKPWIQAAENNKQAILHDLRRYLEAARDVLEIGSGTGQHAVHFATYMPWLVWHTSDLLAQHAGITAWIDDAGLENLPPPLRLDVAAGQWPRRNFDAVYTSNTLHYLSWHGVEALFEGVASLLASDGWFVVYGPFNEAGRFTSDGNRRLDLWLRQHDPEFGLRDRVEIETLARDNGFELHAAHPMPANNWLLVWRRAPG
jgi:cyclopropane fatty-acyl-phospholipid synthase-like methyltransferase